MARRPLLNLVQSILNDLDADSVSSITDTVEAERVATILQDTYYSITSDRSVPELRRVMQLYGLSDSLYPNYLEIPTGVSDIEWVQYNRGETLDNTDLKFGDLTYLDPHTFMTRVSNRDETGTDITIVYEKVSNTPMPILNNKHPEFFTTFDDKYLVTDSWKLSVEDTLQQIKNRAYVRYIAPFTIDDDFIPEVDQIMEAYLLAEAKSRAFSIFKGGVDQKLEQDARRRKVYIQNDQSNIRIDPKTRLPNYGR